LKDEEEEESEGNGTGAAKVQGDPTYELASARRNIAGTESLTRFVQNSRKMFMLQVGCLFFIRHKISD